MKIKRLLIQNFRNIAFLDLSPSPSFNVIYGANGTGKTSFLEAISYLGFGRSFRTSKYQSLIKDEDPFFSISADLLRDEDSFTDEVGVIRYRQKSQNSVISVNTTRSSRIIDLIDKTSVQVIHPQGINLVLEGPELRRNYLDWGIYYTLPEYKKIWSDYKRLLNSRNALLRDKQDLSYLEFIDNPLSELSENISELRENYLESLLPILSEKLSLFLPDFSFEFSYSKGWEKGISLSSVLALNIEKDRNLGYTFYGCHRADLKIKTNNFPASELLSRGQLKLLVCAMRLAQGELLKQQANKRCIYLIDDISSELDERSRSILLQDLRKSDNQVFITNIAKDIKIQECEGAMLIDIASLVFNI